MARLTKSIQVQSNYSSRDWRTQEGQALADIRARLRAADPSPLVGEELRWPRADGYARYIIVHEQPLTLAHLEIGDAWTVEPALIRGLRLADARAMVEQERRIAALFAKRA